MYNLNINYNNNNNNIITELNKFMLNSIKNTSMLTEIKDDIKDDIKDEVKISKKINTPVARSSIYVDYNKSRSKHKETTKPYNLKKLDDKLFWCFYKLYNNVSDNDLDYINTFTTEKEFKHSVIEKINNNKDLLKKHKIQKNFVATEITNDKKITLYTFKTLCILYNIDIVVIKDNNTYTCFTDNNLENNTTTIDNLDNYHAIKLIYKNTSSINKNYDIIMQLDKLEVKNAVDTFYYVKNLEKPLKSVSGYKSIEIIEIAQKLNITLTNEHGKKKTKTELYSESIKKLT